MSENGIDEGKKNFSDIFEIVDKDKTLGIGVTQ